MIRGYYGFENLEDTSKFLEKRNLPNCPKKKEPFKDTEKLNRWLISPSRKRMTRLIYSLGLPKSQGADDANETQTPREDRDLGTSHHPLQEDSTTSAPTAADVQSKEEARMTTGRRRPPVPAPRLLPGCSPPFTQSRCSARAA